MGVKFISVKLKASFLALENKNPLALYWIEDTKELYKGSILFGTGAAASEQAAGLLSAEDYAKLQALIASGFGLNNLVPVDGSIVIEPGEDNKTTIGVGLSAVDGNMLSLKNDGLYVAKAPEYAIEKQATATEGFSATYKLKKTVDGVDSYVGDEINIARDLVLQSATLETVIEDGKPYDGAAVGDPYIKMVFNNAEASNLYVPVKSLVDTYTEGTGISITGNEVSVKLATETHGLVVVNGGGLALELATTTSDGAMSKEDKALLDELKEACTWSEM